MKPASLVANDVIKEMEAAEVLKHLRKIGFHFIPFDRNRGGFITALCNVIANRTYPEFRAAFVNL